MDNIKIHVRQTTDSFDDDAIRGAIESTGRRMVLIAGIATEIAVQRAALGGKERGFNGGVVLSSVPAVIGELAIDFSDPRSQKAFGLLAQL